MSYICSNCIGEEFLRKLASAEATDENSCEYCNSDGPTVEIELIAEKCDVVIETFYELTSQTTAVVHFGRTPAGEGLSTIIENLTKVPRGAIEDIIGALGQTWFDRDTMESKYGEDDPWFVLKKRLDSPMSARWRRMESSLRNEARHLNPNVAEFMAEVFGDIAEDVAANGESVLVKAGPGY